MTSTSNRQEKIDMQTNFQKVGEFMRCMGQDVKTSPMNTVDKRLINLRMVLIAEEAGELGAEFLDLLESTDNPPKLRNLAKELTDLLYVVYGAGQAFGIDLDKCFEEVHNSNLSKLGNDGRPVYRDDGKVVKGPNYMAPDMRKIVG
jgi:predicted HAD superfamily Cof-like phosphohydrolase